MSTRATKLRLGPLPKTETFKLSITLAAALKADLERYAELHARAYGEPVDVAALIPHMLEAFMTRDRGFRKGAVVRAPEAASPKAFTESDASPSK